MPLTDEQKEAVYSVDRNVLVSAGAGSGKTHVLVERYVEILRSDPDLTTDGLIAVTFTRKAAGEMRNRLKKRFKELAEKEDIEQSARWHQCLTEIDSARIGTIHSLCESILKSFPAESSVDPQFEVIDEVSQAELLKLSIEQAFREVLSGSEPELVLLQELNIDDVRRWLVATLSASSRFGESFESLIDLPSDRLLSHMNEVRRRVQSRILRDLISQTGWRRHVEFLCETSFKDALEEQRLSVVEACSRIETIRDSRSSDEAFVSDLWICLDVIDGVNLRIGGRSEEAKAIRESMKSLRDLLRDCLGKKSFPPRITIDDLEAFKWERSICRLFQRASQIYGELKKAEHKLDYDDLIQLAYRSLHAENSGSRKFFQERVRAILVDEFQDTNKLQSSFIGLLTGEKTRLFLIGDDKQSIYKFQGADVSNFNEWRDALEGRAQLVGGPKSLSSHRLSSKLTGSFRSHPLVVEFVNALFSRLLPPGTEDAPYRASFQALVPQRAFAASASPIESSASSMSSLDSLAHGDESVVQDDDTSRPGSEGLKSAVQILVGDAEIDGERIGSAAFQLNEARAVSTWLENLVASDLPLIKPDGERYGSVGYGDCAILVPTNKDFYPLEIALTERGIPYKTFGGRGYLNRPEVVDMENLCRFLGDKSDDHALFGILRSPMFAVSDDVLHDLFTRRERDSAGKLQSAWTSISSSARRAWTDERLNFAVAQLRRFIEDSTRMSLVALLVNVIRKTSYDTTLLSAHGGRQRSRNLWKLVSLARDSEELSCSEFANLLARMREFNIKQSDAPLDSGNVVKLMTLHSSKGLEFPVVALPSLFQRVNKAAGRLIYHRSYGVAMNTSREDSEEPSTWYRYAARLERDMENAERRRLLYVGMTRARDYLGIFLQRGGKRQESFNSWIIDGLSLDIDSISKEGLQSSIREGSHSAPYFVHLIPPGGWPPPKETDSSVSSENSETVQVRDLRLIGELDPESFDASPPLPSWQRVTPAPLSGPESSEILAATTIGEFFHSLMEGVSLSLARPSREAAESLAISLGSIVSHPTRMAALIEEGELLLNVFFESELFGLMSGARRRWSETPYTILREEDIMVRRPDLLLETKTGDWLVIDYKTDHVDLESLSKQGRLHLGQLQGYVRDLKALTGIEAKPMIYFARPGVLHGLESISERDENAALL